MNRKILSQQQGQSAVLIALMMVGLIAMVGLAVDGGEVYLSRRDAQNAADAGAFAGVQALTYGNSVYDAIDTFVQENHVEGSSDFMAYFIDSSGNEIGSLITSGSSVPNGATGVVVTATVGFQPLFISILQGGSQIDINARAKAQGGHLSGSPVVPMTLSCPQLDTDPDNPCGFVKDQPAVLKGISTTSGNLQWIAYLDTQPDGTCSGANDLAGFLSDPPNPIPPIVNTGDWVCGNTGSVNSEAIRTQLKYWVDQNKTQERPWIVPIYDCIGHDGGCDPNTPGFNARYHIVAFGAFILTGYDLSAGPGGGCKGNAPMRYDCDFNVKNGKKNGEQQYDCQYWDPAANKGKGDWVFPKTCIQGKFISYTKAGPVNPGPCNQGIAICGLELKE